MTIQSCTVQTTECNTTHTKPPLFATAVENLSTSHWYFLPFLCNINPYVCRLFYWLPTAREKTWMKACCILSRRRYGRARHSLRDTRCETFTHCQYPSVYLAAKMVVVMENKCSLQRPLKMNAGNEQITQGFPKHSGHFMPQVERSLLAP